MAYAVSNVTNVYDGAKRIRLAKITPDSAYAVSGGETIAASSFGLQSLDELVIVSNGGYRWEWVATTGKLKCYSAYSDSVSTAVALEADARDFSAIPLWVLAIGN